MGSNPLPPPYIIDIYLLFCKFTFQTMVVSMSRRKTRNDGQSVRDQTVELKAAGASRTFAEKLSGARSNRPMLRKALAALDDGDTLMVVRLDRLARSTRDLLTSCMRSATSVRRSRACTTAGPIPPRRTAG